MNSVDDFQRLIDAIRDGSNEAVQELANRVGPHVLAVVRRRLSDRARSRLDSVDCQQEVWASFFTNRDRLAEFKDEEALIRFLSRMTRAKVIDQCRRMAALKRGGANPPTPQCSELLEKAATREPTPSQTAMSREQWQRMLEGLGEPDRQIMLLRSQGSSLAEISHQLNITPRTIRRKITELARRININ